MRTRVRLYEKANSFVGLRYHDNDTATVYERVRRLADSLGTEPATDYQTQIVQRACADALSELEPALARPPDETVRFTLREHVVQEIKRQPDENLFRYLFYRYRYDVFPQTQQLDDFPPCLQIEPSSVCNYRCVFCYQTDREFTLPKNGYMGLMSLDLFKWVIDQAAGNVEAVTLASRGEPLLCPQIEEMLAYVSGKFLALKINTNAWYLDERKAHAILQSGANTLVISADAASEPLYSQLRVRGKLERVLANVEQFEKIRRAQYPGSRLITRVSGVRYAAQQSLDDMEGAWGGLVDQVAFVDYNPWENTYERPFSEVATPCSDLWRRMFVWQDGTVNPCDVDYRSTLAVGNAATASLTELWTGDAYAALREAHLGDRRDTVSPCNRCTFV